MSVNATLQELSRQVRRDTLRLFDEAEASWLTYAPPGTSNHILWHAGHAIWLQDVLGIRLLTNSSELPDGWADTFGMNCRPLEKTTHWPTREKVRELLVGQLHRLVDLLGGTSESRLVEIADAKRGTATISDRIIHGLHDEAKHGGEMHLLLKLCRAQH